MTKPKAEVVEETKAEVVEETPAAKGKFVVLDSNGKVFRIEAKQEDAVYLAKVIGGRVQR